MEIVNGGFEKFQGDQFTGYSFHDRPGEISFVDHEIVKEGKTALRFEHFGEVDPQHGHARVMQEISVHPHRYYRFTCWVKTEDMRGSFKVQVLVDSRSLAPYDPGIRDTTCRVPT